MINITPSYVGVNYDGVSCLVVHYFLITGHPRVVYSAYET